MGYSRIDARGSNRPRHRSDGEGRRTTDNRWRPLTEMEATMNQRFPLTDEQRAKAVDTVMRDVDDKRPRVRQVALRTVVQMDRLNQADDRDSVAVFLAPRRTQLRGANAGKGATRVLPGRPPRTVFHRPRRAVTYTPPHFLQAST